MVFQVFFVDDPTDPEWKVVLEKQPRSKRHSQEDDDEQRPDAAEHVFNAPGLHIPLTRVDTAPGVGSAAGASTSRGTNYEAACDGDSGGENVAEAEVRAASEDIEAPDDPVGWVDEDYEDEDDNLPMPVGITENNSTFY